MDQQYANQNLHNVRMPRACKRMQPPPTGPQPRRTRKSRAATMAEMNFAVEQQNAAMYNQASPTAQMPQQTPSNFLRPEHEQSRYNTRSAMPTLHNLPLEKAPSMSKYWANNLSRPATAFTHTVPSAQQPLPQDPAPQNPPIVATPVMKEINIQTEFCLTEGEANLLQSLHARHLDINKIKSIIDRVDYITAYERNSPPQTPTSRNNLRRIMNNDCGLLAAIMYSQAFHDAGAAAVQMSMNMLPALEYNQAGGSEGDNNDTSDQNEEEEEEEQGQAEDLSMHPEEVSSDDNNNFMTETPQVLRAHVSNTRQRATPHRREHRDFNQYRHRNAQHNQQGIPNYFNYYNNNINWHIYADKLRAATMFFNAAQMNYNGFPPSHSPPYPRMPQWSPYSDTFNRPNRPRPPWT